MRAECQDSNPVTPQSAQWVSATVAPRIRTRLRSMLKLFDPTYVYRVRGHPAMLVPTPFEGE